MMTCRKFAEVLIDFVSGELDPELRTQIEQHLGICPPCIAYLETYRLTIQLTRQLPPVPMPPECEQRLRAALAAALKE
jgi:anti-sigma factor RsiW